MREIKYKCKHCNEWLVFYADSYICPCCGVIFYEHMIFTDYYVNKNGDLVHWCKDTYLDEKEPKRSQAKELTIYDRIQMFANIPLDKAQQTKLWLFINKKNVVATLKELNISYKYGNKLDDGWTELIIMM